MVFLSMFDDLATFFYVSMRSIKQNEKQARQEEQHLACAEQ